MDLSTKQLLSSSLLDLARGLKKLRCVVDRLGPGTKNSPNSPTVAKNSPNSISLSEFCISNGKSGDKKGTTIPDSSEDGDPPCTVNGHSPADWLFHPQNDWKSFPATCAFLFGETLRADRFKNQWVEDVTCVKGWRKISAEHLHDLYQQAWSFGDSVASIVEYAKSQDNFNCDWQDKPDISDAKWLTRSCLWDQDRDEKVWRKWLIGVHNKLPALNLPSVRRV